MEENITPATNLGIWGKCKAGFAFCKNKIASCKSKIWHFALIFLAFFAIEFLAYIMLLPSVGFCLLFGLFWSALFTAILFIIPRKASRIVFGILYFLFLVWTLSQLGYYQVFDKLMWLSALAYTGEGMMFIFDVLSKFPLLWWIAAVGLIALGVVIIVKYPATTTGWKSKLPYLAICAICIVTIALIPKFIVAMDAVPKPEEENYTDVTSYEDTYESLYDVKKVYDLCGVYHMTFRDLWTFNFYKWTAKYEKETKGDIEELKEYFADRPDHQGNDMTGLFEGKNVVYVLMESMDDWLITSDGTPTIYRLMNEGIQFTNFFTPGYGSARTLNTEFCMNTGIYLPTNGEFIFNYTDNSFEQAIAAQFSGANYTGYVFHYNSPEYYRRGIMEPMVGYEAYLSYEDYNETEDDLFNDCFLFDNEKIKSIFFRDGMKFNTIITRAAHLGYTYDEVLSEYALKQYPDWKGTYPTEEEDVARLKARLVDDMFTRLLAELDAAGELENTVIIGVTDHYTYGCRDIPALYHRSGVDPDHKLLLERTPCFIWSYDGPKMKVDKTLHTADLVPTILNLFAIESPYEYLGQDAFDSNYEGYALFPNGSWISDGVVCVVDTDGKYDILYNEKDKLLTPDYIDRMCKTALDFIQAGNKIVTTNYYGLSD